MTDAPTDTSAADAAPNVTSLNRGWLIKFGLFCFICLGLGAWGLYDALIAFPQRGRADAKFQLADYLDIAREQDVTLRGASVADPVAALAELEGREGELRKSAAEFSALNPQSDAARRRELLPRVVDLERLEWLRALHRVGDLRPENTTFENPGALLTELKQYKSTTAQPAPLSGFDMPVQWGFVVVGFGLGGWLLYFIMRSAATKFTWDPGTKALTLPGGRTISPLNLDDLDKRKWDKFYVTVTTTDGQPPVTLDLLRFDRLEGWILEIERAKFPDRAPKPEPEAPAPAQDAPPFPPAA